MKNKNNLVWWAGPLIAVTAMFFLLCVPGINPYDNPGLTEVDLDSTTVRDGDSIAIFSTFTFAVDLYLPVHIDSLRLSCPANRFWTDSVLTARVLGGRVRVAAEISLFDTGVQPISVTAYLSNGDSLFRRISCRAYSPLVQPDIFSEPGETFLLQTEPVNDSDVIYVWNLGSTITYRQPLATLATRIESALSNTMAGLFIESGRHRSPVTHFSVDIADRTPPTITLGQTVSRKGHIYTGNAVIELQFMLADKHGTVAGITINEQGAKADSVKNGVSYVNRRVDGIDLLGPDSVRLVVAATDLAGNQVIDTFWVHHDAAILPTDTPAIIIQIPAADSQHVSQVQLPLVGILKNIDRFGTLYVYATVNGVISPLPDAVSSGEPFFQFDLLVEQPVNTIALVALADTGGSQDTIARAVMTVFYQPGTAVDTIRPDIVEVSVNSVPVAGTRLLAADSATIEALVFDRESGIASVAVAGVAAQTTDQIRYRARIALSHDRVSSAILVAVADSAGNRSEYSFELIRNYPPVLTVPLPDVRIAVDSLFRCAVVVSDADGDPVTISARVSSQRAGGIDDVLPVDDQGMLTWRPQAADTGICRIALRFEDGLEMTADTFVVLVEAVTDTQVIDSIRLVISEKDFPDSLTAGVGSLSVTLRTVSTGWHLFTAKLMPSQLYLLNNTIDSTILWTPQLADTGLVRLEIVATTALGASDTFVTSIRIVKPPAPVKVSFKSTSLSSEESMALVRVPIVLGEAARDSLVIDYAVVPGGTTADSADYRIVTPRPLRLPPATMETFIEIAVTNDTLDEHDETIELRLTGILAGDAVVQYPDRLVVTIVDDDTAEIVLPPVTISFGLTEYSSVEGDYTVTVPIHLSAPARNTVTATIITGGTATNHVDYLFNRPLVTIPQGDSIFFLSLTLFDDAIDEPDTEIVELTLSAVMGAQPVEPLTFRFYIIDNDLPVVVPSRIGFIQNRAGGPAINTAMIDSLRAGGHDVVAIRDNILHIQDWTQFDAVVIPQSLTHGSTGQLLRSYAVPVLCLNSEDYLPLGLSKKAPALIKTNVVQEYETASVLPNGMIHTISQKNYDYPWVDPLSGTKIVATVKGDPSAVMIYTLEQGTVLNDNATVPARRAVMCMTADAEPMNDPSMLTAAWWQLFQSMVSWTLTGSR